MALAAVLVPASIRYYWHLLFPGDQGLPRASRVFLHSWAFLSCSRFTSQESHLGARLHFYSATITIGLSRQLLVVLDKYTSPFPTSSAVKKSRYRTTQQPKSQTKLRVTVSYPCYEGHSFSAPLFLCSFLSCSGPTTNHCSHNPCSCSKVESIYHSMGRLCFMYTLPYRGPITSCPVCQRTGVM